MNSYSNTIRLLLFLLLLSFNEYFIAIRAD